MRDRWRRATAPLRGNPGFVRFLIASRINTLGNTMSTGAIAFAVLATGGGPAGIALVIAAHTVTTIAFAPVLATAADRLPRVRAIACAGSTVTLVLILEAALVATGRGTVANLAATAAVTAAAGSLSGGAGNGVSRDLVSAAQRPAANALLRLIQYATSMAGPAAGGALVAGAGPAPALAINAAFTGLSVIVLRGVTVPPVTRERAGFTADVRAGWAAILARRWLWSFMTAGAVLVPFWQVSFLVLGPAHARDHLGGASSWGLITAAYGGGMAAGATVSLLTQPRRAMRVACTGSAALALPPAAFAAQAPLAVVMAATAAGAAGLAMSAVSWRTAIQDQVPADLQGRVGTYTDTTQIALAPAAFVLVGPMLTVMSPSCVQTLCAAVIAAASLAPLALGPVRRLTLHLQEPEKGDDADRPP